MDASKKQREPVAFKSLAELKRFIRPGVELKTVSHANHADMVGLTRVVTTVQTVGFYSKIKDQPEHPFSTCNHGKGFYTDFGKAGNYIFDGTTVKVKDTRKQDRGVIYELEFYDREQNMEETMMDRKMVNFIKEQYPPGTRIRLNSMKDPYHPILPGTEGEVDFVDDGGQIFMKWNNGRTLPLAPGKDSFTVLPPKLTTLKLYMPLTADLYERNEYGDFDDSSTLLEGRELRGYQDQITAALVKNRMPEESERGLMHWYDEADSVNRKVHSAVFAVEVRDRQLWGVAECLVAGELSDTALETLKEYLTGQASDGWGEGFEQREIDVGDGKLYVHFWQDHDFELKRDVPDMTEFKKLLNRPKKPKMQLIGQDGNIFNLVGIAARTLREAGLRDQAKELTHRIFSGECHSYGEALCLIGEYVTITDINDHSHSKCRNSRTDHER